MKKGFQQDKKNKKGINKNKIKNMQISHKLYITGIIYMQRIQKQSGAVMLMKKKYQKTSKD